MPRANPQQDKKYYSYDPRQTHSDFHSKIGHKPKSRLPLITMFHEQRGRQLRRPEAKASRIIKRGSHLVLPSRFKARPHRR
jgi:hypothetical protein